MFEFIYFSPKKLKLHKRSLLNVLEFKNEKEKILVEFVIKSAINESTNLYALKDKKIIALIALSASSIMIDKRFFPAVNIDLLFVNNSYRNKVLKELNGNKVSSYLVDFAIFNANEVKNRVAVRFLSLFPFNKEEKLIRLYEKMGFFKLKSGFMVMKI
jgi:hypothetical protein